jgi:hypothetical protein
MSTPSNRATNPAGKSPRKKNVSLDLPTARRMLPLVEGIVGDVTSARKTRDKLSDEQDLLDGTRLSLDWAGRQRRYAVADDLAQAEKALAAAVAELTGLGLRLADEATGAVDFPTRINGRPAAFAWQPGDEGVGYWRYADEDRRRAIPADWQGGTPIRHRADS